MKRAAAVLLTLALMLSLTACMSRGSMQLKRADVFTLSGSSEIRF